MSVVSLNSPVVTVQRDVTRRLQINPARRNEVKDLILEVLQQPMTLEYVSLRLLETYFRPKVIQETSWMDGHIFLSHACRWNDGWMVKTVFG